eukprot:UN14404
MLFHEKINFSLKIWGQGTFSSTRASIPYCAPTCKGMKRWVVLDAVCTLNYKTAQKLVAMAQIF